MKIHRSWHGVRLRRTDAGADPDEPARAVTIPASWEDSAAAGLAAGHGRRQVLGHGRAGFAQAFNIAGGFEGDADEDGHRGNSNGWKAADLPWRQG